MTHHNQTKELTTWFLTLLGPYHQYVIGTLNTSSQGPIHQFLTDTAEGYNLGGAGFTYHTLWPSQ
jgi:hypothetical protein